MNELQKLQDRRLKAIADARAILDKAKAENRDLNAEERANYDKAFAEQGALKDTIDLEMRQAAAEAEMAAVKSPAVGAVRADAAAQSAATKTETRSVELRKGLRGEDRTIRVERTPDVLAHEGAWRRFLMGGATVLGETEARALQKDSAVAGGYLSAPVEWQARLIQALDDNVFMRQICRVHPPVATADSLGFPSLDNDPADPTWVAELSIGSEDSTMTFGKRELKPHPMAQYLKVSKTLLRRSAVGVDAIVRERLAYKSAVVLENAYLNGSGALQPLGVFTASANGINTDRDVSTGNTTTSMTFDGLLEAAFTLKAQYRRNCRWLFHRDGIKQIAKLQDGDGQYIWRPNLAIGEPSTLLSYPVMESEYVPSTFTTGLYVGILGDFSYYEIVDALTMTVQVLIELYAASNQNGYISRLETDGMPVHSSAFVRVTLA